MNSRYWRRARRLTVSERRLLLRHGRSLAAVALFHALLVVALWLWGTLDAGGLYVSLLLGALAVITVVYLLLIETGATLEWRESSLSVPMALGLVIAFLIAAFPMNEARISAMILFFPLLLLVSFRLGARSLLSLALLASVGYALMLALALATRGLRLSLSLELLQWLIFTLVALSFAVTGSGVNGLRRSLEVKNQALADALEQVRDLAIRDDLTGLFNRRHILEVLEHQKALADNQIYPFSVCYVDLDHFKRINDEYGHDMGDRVLRQFAEHTLDNLREGDYLARLGGEEFILVLPQSDLAGAELVAERLRESWAARSFEGRRGPPAVSLSAGVASYRGQETVDQLLGRADRALYRAKTGGRNRVCREDDL
ncbi:MAG TPA: GGDEF domain-containing protein [Alcanivorax sp.]|nr:GGDEF domain-containing protein [Alcanivorax sp.]